LSDLTLSLLAGDFKKTPPDIATYACFFKSFHRGGGWGFEIRLDVSLGEIQLVVERGAMCARLLRMV